MTRKDYEVIAIAFAQAFHECKNDEQKRAVNKAIEHVSHALQVENSRFQPKRFRQYIFLIGMELK